MKTKLQAAAIIAVLLAGCEETELHKIEREWEKNVKSRTGYGNEAIYTVVHDGHWFVLKGRYSKSTMLHHPDCPCGKAR